MKERLRQWTRRLKTDVMMLWFSYRHPDTPLVAKWLAVATAAYALSPIDLIPDFVPVIGYLDDIIILPIMIYVTVRLIPRPVLEECRRQAEEWLATEQAKPTSYTGAAVIIAVWLFLLGLVAWAFADELATLLG
jgi:uncharacterized membrane protein YkvA (DUF1232 family)